MMEAPKPTPPLGILPSTRTPSLQVKHESFYPCPHTVRIEVRATSPEEAIEMLRRACRSAIAQLDAVDQLERGYGK